jgi:hypothetical protein
LCVDCKVKRCVCPFCNPSARKREKSGGVFLKHENALFVTHIVKRGGFVSDSELRLKYGAGTLNCLHINIRTHANQLVCQNRICAHRMVQQRQAILITPRQHGWICVCRCYDGSTLTDGNLSDQTCWQLQVTQQNHCLLLMMRGLQLSVCCLCGHRTLREMCWNNPHPCYPAHRQRRDCVQRATNQRL